jgi:hypothetical protein
VGQQKKVVTVSTNDIDAPEVQLQVSANIRVDFQFYPAVLKFEKINIHEESTQTASFYIFDPTQNDIADITSSSSLITAKQLPPSTEDMTTGRIPIEVTVLPGMPLGNFNESITITSKQQDVPPAVLQLSGSIVGELEVIPGSLRFLVDLARGLKYVRGQTVTVVNRTPDQKLKLVEVRDLNDSLDLVTRTLQEDQMFEINATIKQKVLDKGENVSGDILIQTNNAQLKEVKIPYRVFIR